MNNFTFFYLLFVIVTCLSVIMYPIVKDLIKTIKKSHND